jgi:cystathionine beta-lyase/cystathionine gamma-synthase
VRKLLPQFGLRGVFVVDARDPAAIAAAISPTTRMIVLESPNSLTFEQQDLAAIAAIAKARGIVTPGRQQLCDASLVNRRSAHGIDLVAHSATKYLMATAMSSPARCAAPTRRCARCSTGRT